MSDYQDEGGRGGFFPPLLRGGEEAETSGLSFSIIHMYDEKGSRLRDSIRREEYAGMLVYADVMSQELKKELDAMDIP